MGVNDDREMLEVAKEECGRLERENAELLAMYQRLIEDRSAAWAESDALAAVIEQVRSCRHDIKPSGGMMGEIWYDVQSVDRALATAPTVALEAVKAEAWWRGVSAQWKHRPIGNRLPETASPYRKTDTKGGE